ncbi:hypothetical protein ACWD5A_40625, partial [Streptomyces sp. NPDC002491]
MNSPEELDELAEMARLLPAGPVERGLPPERHSHHKDLLMQLIDRDAAAAAPSTTGRPSRPRRFSRPVLLAACVAVAATATLTVTLADGPRGAVVTVRLHRPHVLNALNAELLAELLDVLRP